MQTFEMIIEIRIKQYIDLEEEIDTGSIYLCHIEKMTHTIIRYDSEF